MRGIVVPGICCPRRRDVGAAGEPRTKEIEVPTPEHHRTGRVGWLRAAVLGANDGIVSTASLVLGVAAAHAARSEMLVAGVAGLVAGAMSMAAGEYVSVSSQADTERADLEREQRELAAEPGRGAHGARRDLRQPRPRPELAQTGGRTAHGARRAGAHARDELGISEVLRARPVQAALASAATFAVGARAAAAHGRSQPARPARP